MKFMSYFEAVKFVEFKPDSVINKLQNSSMNTEELQFIFLDEVFQFHEKIPFILTYYFLTLFATHLFTNMGFDFLQKDYSNSPAV